MRAPALLVALLPLALAGCQERIEADPAWATRPLPTPETPIDTAMASAGARLFDRQCVACHVLEGEELIGPALEDVVHRREPAWILAMITEPDSMLLADSIAQALWREYGVPMIDTGLDDARARAVLEYLRVAEDGR